MSKSLVISINGKHALNFVTGGETMSQCSPEVPAAGIFISYSHFKHQLLLLDNTTENDSSVYVTQYQAI